VPVAAPDRAAVVDELAVVGERVHAYARAVVAGEIVAGELLQLACERHLRDLVDGPARGLRFDPVAAGWAIRFFPTMLRHYKGEWGPQGGRPGQPVVLASWEEFIVGSIFGWQRRNPDPTSPIEWIRRFTKAYLEVAKKNGKTLLGAGLGLILAFFDDEAGAEVYTIATKRDQARLLWGDAATMGEKSPAIRARVRIGARSIFSVSTKSKLAPLSAEEGTEEGINPHAALVDELHRVVDAGMFEMIENSFGARLQPILVIITTSGEAGAVTVWSKERGLAERVLRGTIEADTQFAAVYAIDPRDDPFDERVWPKANPGLGVSPKLDEMRQRAADAKAEPSKLNAFLRLRLNRPASSESRLFEVRLWETPEAKTPLEDASVDARAWGGLDLGWSRDLSAFALWVPRDDAYEIVLRCWAPEAAANARGDGLYERFAEQGWLTITDGDVRDDDILEEEIIALAREYGLERITYDRALASGLVVRLGRAGIDVEPVGQGWVSLSPAVKELDRLLAAKQIRHGDNRLLTWMAANADGKWDDNGNVRPVKPNRNSQDKIDGVSAVLDAIAGWIGDTSELPEGPSAYESYRSLTV
jgi:phage terminase large subunit-like protein